ncbi:hypothetical protein [Cupriavidus pauculus]|uniref:hypothetical protein n=1 Tax=Cupriavidus pauculus TaxID=82633 RepID=UPI001EE23ADB|nr:hypothetical protein [Cupriavidus pauculus]GJG98770.1 hypothetical protein CBA19C6_29795 [Cupriavidus pauculus]
MQANAQGIMSGGGGNDDDAMPPPAPASGKRYSIKDLKGCLAGRRPAPTREEIDQAVTEADAKRRRNAAEVDFTPGKSRSIGDLKGCLAGRVQGVAPTAEEIKGAIAESICNRYLRSFA